MINSQPKLLKAIRSSDKYSWIQQPEPDVTVQELDVSK